MEESSIVAVPTADGHLISPRDQTTYSFIAGTFSEPATVTYTPRFAGSAPPTGELTGINHFFEVSAVSNDTGQPVQPGRPYTVTAQYTDAEKGPAMENTLGLYFWDGAQWVREPTSEVDVATNTICDQDRVMIVGGPGFRMADTPASSGTAVA